ncbi:type II toxin-antitoxin system HicA family toxin [Herbaspirillum robiniae]|uniref:type II toxin-antitoxin system HicA family toxin n=1 Tax=Herbaspirillum robiniae TaxID=2014887 RepID=UPI003D784EDE
MKSAHQKTLAAIFGNPVPTSLEWRKIEALFEALGAQIVEGNGSRVRFVLNGGIGTFHRPHPTKEAKPYQVRDVRLFLQNAGITPEWE